MTETFHAGPGLGRLSDVTIIHGDCIEAMAELAADSVDAVVCDPPYGLEFMGKEWDKFGGAPARFRDATAADGKTNGITRGSMPDAYRAGSAFQQWCELWCREALRVLKPGGHLLAFGGTRTWHRLAVAVEDAGFEIRDSIAWLYGSGFPKSLDVSKAIDKAAGATREVVGTVALNAPGGSIGGSNALNNGERYYPAEPRTITAPATPEAAQWSGWGTALKPAFEPVVVARKPIGGVVRTVCGACQGEDDDFMRDCLVCDGDGYVTRKVGGTVAANVLAHGTGALNIDATRIGNDVMVREAGRQGIPSGHVNGSGGSAVWSGSGKEQKWLPRQETAGRWPANVCLDADQAAALDEQSGITKSTGGAQGGRLGANGILGEFSHNGPRANAGGLGDSGGASRFFYVAKAPKKERPTYVDAEGKQQSHATVKPLALMRWLVRLVTPPGGVVLDPFAGSGTTVEAALLEDFRVIGIEREADYLPMIQQRIARCLNS